MPDATTPAAAETPKPDTGNTPDLRTLLKDQLTKEQQIPEIVNKGDETQAEAPVEEPAAEIKPETPNPLVLQAQQLGYQVTTPEEASQRIADYLRIREAEFARYQQHLQAQQQPAPKPEAPKGPFANWTPVDEAMVAQYQMEVEKDGQKVTTWRPEAPMDLRHGYEQHLQRKRQWADALVNRPEEALKPVIEQYAQQLFEQKMGEYQAKQQADAQFQRVINQNSWMFEKAANGETAYAADGTPKLTDAGNRAFDELTRLTNDGMPEAKAWDYALRLAKAEHGITNGHTVKETPRPSAAELEAQRQARQAQALANAQSPAPQGNAADRSGTFGNTTPQRSQNANLGFGGKLLQNLGKAVTN